MSGISGAGGAGRSARTDGVSGVDPASTGGAQEAEAASGATSGAPRTRARSVDVSGLSLASSLHASFDAAAKTGGGPSRYGGEGGEGATEWIRPLEKPPETAAELAASIASLERGHTNDVSFAGLAKKLEGRVTTQETKQILKDLGDLGPRDWLATIDRLKATPSDERGLSLLDKLVKYGVNDRNKFIAAFADQANVKLGTGFPTLDQRAGAHEDEGMRPGKARRLAAKEVRSESDLLLEFFKAKDRMGFVNGLRAVGAVPAAIGEGIIEAPAAILNVLVLLGR